MKVYLDTIGCRLNQSEIENMAREFRAAGHQIIGTAESADLAVVNTCAVTSKAASDSRGKIRHIAHLGVKEIVPTGCWVTLEPQVAASLPAVSQIVTNENKDELVNKLLNIPKESFDVEPIARQRLPGIHHRTHAFIKVQDGCDNHCTFCVTTIARGRSRSRSEAQVLADIRSARDGNSKEIILTGVQLSSWGHDIGLKLTDLIKTILRETDIPRIRLSSLEPWNLDVDFFSLWEDPRLCQHFHLPLQSGSRSTLKRMARKATPVSFKLLVEEIRRIKPDSAITTDIIAGFPGETEAEFFESLEFVREMNFAGGHVFTYSPRPGTGAARMAGQVKPFISKERNDSYRAVLDDSGRAYRQKFKGRSAYVLWESMAQLSQNGWQMEGLTANYLRVSASAQSPRWNILDKVNIINSKGELLVGEICEPL